MRRSFTLAARDPAAFYSRAALALYDPLVMRVFARHVWGCPPEVFLGLYRAHLSGNHAEVGVGTGWCLARSTFPVPAPRLALVDAQPNCLAHAARRLRRHRPTSFVRDVRRPLHLATAPFDSIAFGGVLHCLRGDARARCTVLDRLAAIAAPGATLFGYTLVADAVGAERRSRALARVLETLGAIDLEGLSVPALAREFERRYPECRIERAGCFALFSARVGPAPRGAPAVGEPP